MILVNHQSSKVQLRESLSGNAENRGEKQVGEGYRQERTQKYGQKQKTQGPGGPGIFPPPPPPPLGPSPPLSEKESESFEDPSSTRRRSWNKFASVWFPGQHMEKKEEIESRKVENRR